MSSIIDKIKGDLKKAGRPCSERDREFVERYLGTKRKFLNVKSPDRDKILREVAREIKEFDNEDVHTMLNDLMLSDTYEYINFAGKLLAVSALAKGSINFNDLERWVSPTTGWAECDSICQSLFDEGDAFKNWNEWQKMIVKFSKSNNIQLRRASLVLQVKPNGKSNNPKLRKLAFETVNKLKGEKSVLITKAISWLLRAISDQNKDDTKKYLLANKTTLPSIAFRETMKKIETGRKTR
jgi:3-methyladenine DNA glycosylase AlkD